MKRREFIGALAATPGLPAALTATDDAVTSGGHGRSRSR